MHDQFATTCWTLIAFSIVALKLIKSKSSDPIGYILFFYFFFGFGPVINYLMGMPIYFGIVQENIANASMIMCIGIASLGIPHLITRDPSLVPDNSKSEPHNWEALKIALIVSIGYGVVKCLLMLPLRAQGASKIAMINIALPQLHYVYLLLQMYFCAFYFSATRVSGLKRPFWINVMVYVAYCLIVGE
ncbi:MAG: hypothetical protein KC478_09630, partial [Bacteriovoracaceae bacterium]|nr:hypothetical protein [Bacteriovoracaceae bacterium]